MSRQIYAEAKHYSSVKTLEKAVHLAWNTISQSNLDALIESMRERVLQVIEMKGKRLDY